ncbi:LptF/LptG family permease [Hyphobacterium marinum]|uniref:LptF/LptG family permease n=1 Tax=Hyphobacterium marinum TaxID=3116574 RepID=A0ABU7M086_9PROT|nr:LptF/LptG family permease [Hyphobacterium sp. Y6023]MEE2567193.1 LptF/LptG family permease [Hyphobacterium sp. Y6023]
MILVQRYMFRQLLGPFLTAAGAFAGLALLTQSLTNIELISDYRETALTFLKVTLLALPQLVGLLSPFAIFIAALVGINRMMSDSEITVASASGLSRWGVLSPIVRLGVLALVANLAVNLFIQPLSYREMRESLYELRTDVAASLVRPGSFSRLGAGVTLYARETDAGGRMQEVFINDARDPDGTSTYVAREGVIVRAADRPVMVLLDGNVQQVEDDNSLSFLTFERYEFDLSEFVDAAQVLFFKDSDKFLDELFFPDAASVARARGVERLYAEAHYRLSAPIYNVTMVLIAAAAFFGGQHSRLGYGRRVLIAIGIALTVRMLGFAAQSAAADDAALNIVQYVIPVAAGLAALVIIFRPARKVRPRPAAEA